MTTGRLLRVSFDVDTVQLFDMLKAVGGNHEGIASRLLGVMMTGQKPGFAEDIGMAMYGIRFKRARKISVAEAFPQKAAK